MSAQAKDDDKTKKIRVIPRTKPRAIVTVFIGDSIEDAIEQVLKAFHEKTLR